MLRARRSGRWCRWDRRSRRSHDDGLIVRIVRQLDRIARVRPDSRAVPRRIGRRPLEHMLQHVRIHAIQQIVQIALARRRDHRIVHAVRVLLVQVDDRARALGGTRMRRRGRSRALSRRRRVTWVARRRRGRGQRGRPRRQGASLAPRALAEDRRRGLGVEVERGHRPVVSAISHGCTRHSLELEASIARGGDLWRARIDPTQSSVCC